MTRIPPKRDIDQLEAFRQTMAGPLILGTMGRYGIDIGLLRVKEGVRMLAAMPPILPSGERPALHMLGAIAELTFKDVDLVPIANADLLEIAGPALPVCDDVMPGIDEARLYMSNPGCGQSEIRAIRLPSNKEPVVDSTCFGDAFCGFHGGADQEREPGVVQPAGDSASAMVIAALGPDPNSSTWNRRPPAWRPRRRTRSVMGSSDE